MTIRCKTYTGLFVNEWVKGQLLVTKVKKPIILVMTILVRACTEAHSLKEVLYES